MINCFTFTYKTLTKEGLKFPTDFEGYSTNNLKAIIKDYKIILDEKIHYAYFNSFCTEVKSATKNDIIVTDSSIGIAINNLKYLTIKDKNKSKSLETISKDCTIYRVGKDG